MHRNLRLIVFVFVLVSIFVGMGIMSAQPPSTSPYLRSITLPLNETAGNVRVIER